MHQSSNPMFFKSLDQISSFVAGDETIIKEWLHPKNDAVDTNYSLAFAEVEPGKASLPHALTTSSEAYVIIAGEGIAYVGEKSQAVKPGDLVLIPAGAKQYIENTGSENLRFLCIVSPPWSKEDEIVF